MPVTDNSVFSACDEALWGALAESASTTGAALLAWRKDRAGNDVGGRNFNALEVPNLESIAAKDCPALVVDTLSALEPITTGADFETVAYVKGVLGVIRAKPDEVTGDKQVKRFAELVRNTLDYHRGVNNFGAFVTATPHPIRDIQFGRITFPTLTERGLFAFTLEVGLEVLLPHG